MNLDGIIPGGPLRIGAVSYLNTVPLVAHLAELLPGARLSLDHPSRLADDLAAGRLDVALAPSIEVARHPEWSVVSTACIGCRGPVLSVKVLFRTPPERVRRLALDAGSRTSAALAQILLDDMYGVRPELMELPIGASPDDADADAVLVIGDRAIRVDVAASVRDSDSPESEKLGRGFVDSWDLGDRWCRWTELPFVFAVWAARPGVELGEVEVALDAARDRGRASIEAIAREQSTAMGLPYKLVFTYLRDNLNFYLDAGERTGMELFFERARALDLIDNRVVGLPPSPALARQGEGPEELLREGRSITS